MGKTKGKNKGAKSVADKPSGVAAAVLATASKAETAQKAAKKPAEMPAAPVQESQPNPKGSPTMTDQFQQITQMFSPKGFEQYLGQAKEQIEKAQAQTTKSFEGMAAFSKENVDAFVTASTLYAKGFENVGKAWYALGQETLEASSAVAKALLGAKTLKEAVDLQTDFAKTTFDKYAAESTKLSEMTIKSANEALQPINARVNVAVEKMLKPANAA